MRPLIDMDTIQIEITNACPNKCSNCTRLVGHDPKPFFMTFEQFKQAVDSMEKYPKMTGMMGGEPLIHPEFEKMCRYLHSKIAPKQCGLWTSFPKGYEHYREIIAETFGHIFLNDHTRDDIMHCPILVQPMELGLDPWVVRYRIHHCWVQNAWSACINPHGAFFCEIAGAISMIYNLLPGWKVEPGWWTRMPFDYAEQAKTYCMLCGCAMPLSKRSSTDGRDDISPRWYEILKDSSPKVKSGRYVISDCKPVIDDRQMATYKDREYRDRIADRYGMFLVVNELGFQTPYLKRHFNPKEEKEHGKHQEYDTCKPETGREERQCAASA